MLYHSTDTLTSIEAKTYIASYRDVDRFIVFCKECEHYGNCWSCPPFFFDTAEYLSGYDTVFIIGTKITPDPKLLETDDLERNKQVAREILFRERQRLDASLLELEKRYPASKAFFAGVCHLCDNTKCTRIKDEPCLHTASVRPSLEALGFDIGRTASELLDIELKWSSNGMLPEYLTLVSGFFTNHKPDEIIWEK